MELDNGLTKGSSAEGAAANVAAGHVVTHTAAQEPSYPLEHDEQYNAWAAGYQDGCGEGYRESYEEGYGAGYEAGHFAAARDIFTNASAHTEQLKQQLDASVARQIGSAVKKTTLEMKARTESMMKQVMAAKAEDEKVAAEDKESDEEEDVPLTMRLRQPSLSATESGTAQPAPLPGIAAAADEEGATSLVDDLACAFCSRTFLRHCARATHQRFCAQRAAQQFAREQTASAEVTEVLEAAAAEDDEGDGENGTTVDETVPAKDAPKNVTPPGAGSATANITVAATACGSGFRHGEEVTVLYNTNAAGLGEWSTGTIVEVTTELGRGNKVRSCYRVRDHSDGTVTPIGDGSMAGDHPVLYPWQLAALQHCERVSALAQHTANLAAPQRDTRSLTPPLPPSLRLPSQPPAAGRAKAQIIEADQLTPTIMRRLLAFRQYLEVRREGVGSKATKKPWKLTVHRTCSCRGPDGSVVGVDSLAGGIDFTDVTRAFRLLYDEPRRRRALLFCNTDVTFVNALGLVEEGNDLGGLTTEMYSRFWCVSEDRPHAHVHSPVGCLCCNTGKPCWSPRQSSSSTLVARMAATQVAALTVATCRVLMPTSTRLRQSVWSCSSASSTTSVQLTSHPRKHPSFCRQWSLPLFKAWVCNCPL